YLKAAEHGDENAQYCLGHMYHEGTGVTVNESEAVKWWKKAAEQGHAAAANSLAESYSVGAGQKADLVEALRWFIIAVAQASHIDEQQGYSDGDRKDYAAARTFFANSLLRAEVEEGEKR